MGVSKKKLSVPGEQEFAGRGVSYCVDCDANFYRGATVIVAGNPSAARMTYKSFPVKATL